jgi:tetratricopeptide (TPR) repeat protein
MELSDELERKLRIRHEEASVPYAVALHGLGGAGKSQLALDYAKKYKDRYNPILWIDATDEEAVRSSFQRCAAELRLPEEHVEKQGMVLTDARVQAVLRWLRDRTEAEDEWLVIVDNADDISWGLQKIMPKGKRGSLIITSRDERSVKLVTGTCERVHISIMSPVEGVALLLQHLQLDAELASKDIQQNCNEVARKLGYLALAIDVAGAYIGNDYVPEQALSQYLADFDRHRNELLQMDVFRGLLPTQKTVWTVWDTTLEKITKEHAGLQPEMLLTFLAQFKGSIVQDEIFRLASLGMAVVDTELEDEEIEGMPAELRQYSLLDRGEWDSFQYRQSRDVLIRYSLLQRVEGQWAGVTMHSLVQWRAMQSDPSRPWRWWYLKFVLAACCQMTEGQSEFRRHLLMHLQDVSKDYLDGSKDLKQHESFIGTVLGKIYYEERLLDEAKKLFVEVIETHKTKLGADYPDTLTSMDNLASTYTKLGQWEEAEKLELYVIETRKTKLGADHPDTLISMDNLALIYQDQGRWEEAEKLELYIMETRETKLGADHLDTLTSMDHLAVTYGEQGRWKEAEKLLTQVIKTRNIKIGTDHFDTITSLASLAIILWNQGRWDEAEKLLLQVMETCKIKLGKDHPETLISINNYARLLWYQGRRVEAEKLLVQVVETFKTKLGDGHPDTLSSINNLATLYDAQGRWNEAEELLVLVVEARKTKLGVDHPNTLASMNNLASLYKNQGRREEAEKLLISVVETIETKLGAIHPNTLTSMANLALIYQDQSRWKEAEELNIKVIEARKTNLGEDHLDTLTSISNLAMTFESQGRLEEAEKLQVQVIKSFKIKLGADHPDTLTSIANLASTYWKQGRWEEAKELEVQVMEARKTKLGEDHPDTLMSMHKVALTWKDQERHADALALMKACAEARHRVLGPENPHTLSSLAAVELWSR